MFSDDEISQQTVNTLRLKGSIGKDSCGRIVTISMESSATSEGDDAVRGILHAIIARRLQIKVARDSDSNPFLLLINPVAQYLDYKLIALPISNHDFREAKLFAQRREYHKNKKLVLKEHSFAWGGSFCLSSD